MGSASDAGISNYPSDFEFGKKIGNPPTFEFEFELRHIPIRVSIHDILRICFNCFFCDRVRCPCSITRMASSKSPAFLHYVTLHYIRFKVILTVNFVNGVLV